ncbi:MAG: prefoldin subunit [Candidatus Korarchaeota archaeon]
MSEDEIRQIAVLSEQLVQQIQMYQQQQVLLRTRMSEIDNALEELSKISDDGVAYRVVGGVIVKMLPSKIKEDLTKEKDDIELKLKMVESRIERLRKQLAEMDEKLKELLKKK